MLLSHKKKLALWNRRSIDRLHTRRKMLPAVKNKNVTTYLTITRSKKTKTFLQHHRNMKCVWIALSTEESQFLRRKYKETSRAKRRQRTRRHFVLSCVWNNWPKTLRIQARFFQNGGGQSTLRGSGGKTERRVQGLETQSSKGWWSSFCIAL